MLVSKLFHFSPKRAVTLALSVTFLSGHLALATPEADTKANGTVSTGTEQVQDKSPASTGTETASSTASGDAVASEGGGANAAAENVDSEATKETSTASDTSSSATTDAAAALTPDELHEDGIRHWNISKRYMKEWDLDLAQVELDLAIMDYPDLKIAHRDLCIVSLMKFNLWRSVAEFMMTVGLGEPIPMTEDESNTLIEDGMIKHYKKGLVFARQQDWPKAVNELELASQLVTEDFAVQRSLAYGYANLGDFAKAEEHYKKTFELSPQDGSSRADLAYFLAENGKVSEAQKEMEEAVKTQPKAAAYHVDLSWMAENRGDLDTASKELQAALTLNPKNADLWSHLGKVLERKGEKSDAINAYLHAVSLDPKMVNAKESLDKLQASSSAAPVGPGAPEGNTAPI